MCRPAPMVSLRQQLGPGTRPSASASERSPSGAGRKQVCPGVDTGGCSLDEVYS